MFILLIVGEEMKRNHAAMWLCSYDTKNKVRKAIFQETQKITKKKNKK